MARFVVCSHKHVLYYEDLHSLEEEGQLDLSDEVDLFCVHYAILPQLKPDLKAFVGSWNNHPLRTEGNLSPNQLWHIGMLQASVAEPDIQVLLNLFDEKVDLVNCSLIT